MARPSSYKPEYAEQAKQLCLLGATDADLADFFKVTIATIHNWRSRHAAFFESIKLGKDAFDERVENSLAQKAIGYSYDAVKIFNHQGEPLVVPYREHVPPDTAAAIFWLKNRRPQQWRDKREHEVTGKDGDSLMPEYTEDELIARLMAKRQDRGEKRRRN